METNSAILLYDDYCPLCTWYSRQFVRFGLLKPGSRVPFSRAEPSVLAAIDIEKGINEIPLYDPATHQTVYGIEALLRILGQKMPWVERIGNLKAVNWLLQRVYKMVSYNRKVIIARKCGTGIFDCSPAFNSFYRVLFMVIFLAFNSLMLLPLHRHFFDRLSFYHLTAGELEGAHLLLVGLNCVLASFLGKKMAVEYLGQVNILALVSILLLSVLAVLNRFLPLTGWIVGFALGMITFFMIKEYFRRMRYAGLYPANKIIVGVNLLSLITFLGYVFH